ncbi:hypothetical protein FVEG_02299 [Fusarium verticillioides 7600]|uniref:Uncharacterized protein n=1 Tax=Gibberella moniliformis (strain M3125 / FGSC 7600) TaxID=334819 RepID=W7M3N9_GIBM7|nr:hypothetical protein FVEG_02299 [Fusarium verticillioides 7600]EWG39492.1 hypothetical protein FVEG_02299 [Fusarium verticillioides 7600]
MRDGGGGQWVPDGMSGVLDETQARIPVCFRVTWGTVQTRDIQHCLELLHVGFSFWLCYGRMPVQC